MYFQGILAGHHLSVHSYSYGTMPDGNEAFVQCRDAKNDNCANPLPGFSEGPGEQQIWLVTATSCSTQPQPLVLGEDVLSPEAFLGQSLAGETQRWPWAHAEPEVGLRISRGPFQHAFLWSYCLLTPGPIQSKCSCKASLNIHCSVNPCSAWVSVVSSVSTQVSSSFKKISVGILS